MAMAVGKASSGLYGLYSQVGSLRTHFTDIIMQRVAVNSGWGGGSCVTIDAVSKIPPSLI